MGSIPLIPSPGSRVISVKYGFVAGANIADAITGFLNAELKALLSDDRWDAYWVKASVTTAPELEHVVWPEELGPPQPVLLMKHLCGGVKGSPLVVWLRWTGPNREPSIIMSGLEQPHTSEDFKRARRTIGMFWELESRGGRPEEPLRLAEVQTVCRQFRERHGKPPTQEELREIMAREYSVCVEERQFRNKIADLLRVSGLTWNQLKRS